MRSGCSDLCLVMLWISHEWKSHRLSQPLFYCLNIIMMKTQNLYTVNTSFLNIHHQNCTLYLRWSLIRVLYNYSSAICIKKLPVCPRSMFDFFTVGSYWNLIVFHWWTHTTKALLFRLFLTNVFLDDSGQVWK